MHTMPCEPGWRALFAWPTDDECSRFDCHAEPVIAWALRSNGDLEELIGMTLGLDDTRIEPIDTDAYPNLPGEPVFVGYVRPGAGVPSPETIERRWREAVRVAEVRRDLEDR
jgi:hypothetical protein